MNRYVLITPAKNEQDNIERVIKSVLDQTVAPLKWVIVSDGSTDRTNAIVKPYADKYAFIRFLEVPPGTRRSFGSKAQAIDTGYSSLTGLPFDFIGNLDADLTFDIDYFERLLERFRENGKLGIGGGIIMERTNGRFLGQNISLDSVAGAVQMFRRTCFENIGGYYPLEFGGIDAFAEVMARMKGWQVQTFPELKVYHHRRVGIGTADVLRSKFRHGVRDYMLGYGLLFYMVKSMYRVAERPFLLGSFLRLSGYVSAGIKFGKSPLPEDYLKYFRWEQMERLKTLILPSRVTRAIKISRARK